MGYSIHIIYIFFISYILSIMLVIPKSMAILSTENLIIKTHRLICKILGNSYSEKEKQYIGIITTVASKVLYFLLVVLIIYIFQMLNIYLLSIFEIFILYMLFNLRVTSDNMMSVYYNLFDDDFENNNSQIKNYLLVNKINYSDKDTFMATAIELMSRQISEASCLLLISFLFGPIAGIFYKIFILSLGESKNKILYSIYRAFNITFVYVVCAITFLSFFFLKLDYKNALKIFLRDRNKKTTLGINELCSAIAGALNISFGKPAKNFDDEHDNLELEESLIGDDNRAIRITDIKLLVSILYTNSVILFTLAMIFRFTLYILTTN